VARYCASMHYHHCALFNDVSSSAPLSSAPAT